MNILHVTPSYKPAYVYGGPTVSVSQLCEYQRMAGLGIEVLTTTANGRDELPAESRHIDGVPVTFFPRWSGDHTHFSPALLWKLWRKARQYDIVHLHSWWNLVTLPAALICRLLGVPTVLSSRGMLNSYTVHQKPRIWFQATLGRWMLRRTLLHATSERERDEALAFLPGWQCFIAPNIVNTPSMPLHPEKSEPTGGEVYNLVFLSRIDRKKRLDLVLRALARVQRPWRLTVAGAGQPEYVRSLQSQAESLGITDRVDWRGWTEGAEKNRLLAEADLFVLTSFNENFSNAALEALFVGTPVLLSPEVGLSEYVGRNGVGWVCPADEALLAEQLEAVLAHQVALGIGRAAIAARVRHDFEPGRITRQYVEAYEIHLQRFRQIKAK